VLVCSRFQAIDASLHARLQVRGLPQQAHILGPRPPPGLVGVLDGRNIGVMISVTALELAPSPSKRAPSVDLVHDLA